MDNPLPQGAQAVELLSPETQHWRAERELADALSTFQAQVQPATELTLLAVVELAAFRPLGEQEQALLAEQRTEEAAGGQAAKLAPPPPRRRCPR